MRYSSEHVKKANNECFAYMEIIFFSFEFCGCINFGSTNFLNGHFNVIHPFNHFWISSIIHLLNKGVIFLPESHLESCLMTTRFTSYLSENWRPSKLKSNQIFKLFDVSYIISAWNSHISISTFIQKCGQSNEENFHPSNQLSHVKLRWKSINW